MSIKKLLGLEDKQVLHTRLGDMTVDLEISLMRFPKKPNEKPPRKKRRFIPKLGRKARSD